MMDRLLLFLARKIIEKMFVFSPSIQIDARVGWRRCPFPDWKSSERSIFWANSAFCCRSRSRPFELPRPRK